MLFYDPQDPTKGAVAVPQGNYLTEISEEDFNALIESLTPPEPVLPQPQWNEFNLAFLSNPDFISISIVVNSINPLLVSSFPTALDKASKKETDLFSTIYSLFCQTGQVAQEQKQEWADLAIQHNLPQEFVDIILDNP